MHIIHGRRDRLIPFQQGEMLQRINPEKIKLYPIENAGHNNLPDFPEYHDILYDILHEELMVTFESDNKKRA